jgi:hypothetical protein
MGGSSMGMGICCQFFFSLSNTLMELIITWPWPVMISPKLQSFDPWPASLILLFSAANLAACSGLEFRLCFCRAYFIVSFQKFLNHVIYWFLGDHLFFLFKHACVNHNLVFHSRKLFMM